MITLGETFQSGLAKAKLYLTSLARFCKSGFLAGMYGVGSELCQGFCRLSAVHGGTFMLNMKLDKIIKSDNHFKVLTQDDQVFTCKNIIASADFSSLYDNCSSTFSRYIFKLKIELKYVDQFTFSIILYFLIQRLLFS